MIEFKPKEFEFLAFFGSGAYLRCSEIIAKHVNIRIKEFLLEEEKRKAKLVSTKEIKDGRE